MSKHDGTKFHKDGSKFFDIAIFSNAKKAEAYERDLKAQGYRKI